MRGFLSPVSRQYFIRSAVNTFQSRSCPYCGETSNTVIDRKYLVTRLLRCNRCYLNYRHPQDSNEFFRAFYQTDYEVDNAMITDLPSDAKLEELKQTNFPNLRDNSPYLKAVTQPHGTPITVAEYGVSWGYSVFQLRNAGFDAVGCELSRPRAKFGRDKLGLDIVSDAAEIRDNNDVFFSCHVIEHLPSIGQFIELAKRKLKPDGVFVAFCPNGSTEFRRRRPDVFHGGWGLEHINYLSVDFASKMLVDHPYLILTGDWEFSLDEIAEWPGDKQVVGQKRDGEELLIIAKPNVN